MKIIPNEEEVAIDAIPLAVKSPSIVGWKIHKEGRKSYYQIMRADGKSQMYMIFSHMLKSFDREDLEDLYKLVKAKYESTRPVEDLDLILWGDLKTMFEPHVEDKGRIVRIKSLLDAVWITAAHVFVNVAQLELVLLRDFKENMLSVYYYYSAEVNAASENMLEVTTASEYQVNAAIIIEHLAKDGEKSVFWIINDKDRESLLNLKNTMYHSRRICYFPRLKQDQDYYPTLKNTSYPHQQMRRIRYFGQHSKETRFPSNTPYPEKPIRRIQWRLMNILEYNNHGAHSKSSQYTVSDPSNTAYRSVFGTYK
ncbi:hypothetical protein Tco_1531791 [Tanacetum coccineum]